MSTGPQSIQGQPGRYNASTITLNDGQPAALGLDINGNVKVNVVAGGTSGTQYAEGVTTSPATGTVALGRYNSSPPTLSNGQLFAPQLDVNGNLKVSGTFSSTPTKSTTGTQTSVAGSVTNVTILASNSSRLGGTVSNDSTAVLYLKMGTTASTTSYSVKLFQDDYFEIPYNFTGEIDGLWASATGNARVTELT